MIIKRFINGKPVEEIVSTPNTPPKPKSAPQPPTPRPLSPQSPSKKGCGCGK